MDQVTFPRLAPDGRFHPADEQEVAEAICFAAAHGHRLRVQGAGHGPPDSAAGDGPADLVLCLDRLRRIEILDERDRLVRVQAGIHLGEDPSSHGDHGSRENSLLHQLAEGYGWTLSSTGGITHQTVGGFLVTGSAGGSLQHSVLDHVVSVRMVDGSGEIRDLGWGEDPAEHDFPALIASRYPRFDDWLALRAELDPDQVFLTDYWRARLAMTSDPDRLQAGAARA